nr:CooT family nickel-binding protein [Desulfobacula sp.]
MCEASAYLIKDGKETLVLESVDILEPLDESGFMLKNIFGDQKIIKARILRMELVSHKILFSEDTP